MKVLVVGPSWIGDMVMAQALFLSLRQLYPTATIDVVAPQWCAPILQRMPEVHTHIHLAVGHGELGLAVRKRLARAIRAMHYERAIVLPNSWKSALLPFLAKIPQRTGWRGEFRFGLLNDIRYLDVSRYRSTAERFVALAYPPGSDLPPLPQPRLTVSPEGVATARARYSLSATEPVLALCPGAAFGPAKCWPASHYTTVARHKLEQGWQVWLFGSSQDRAVCQIVADLLPDRYAPRVFNLAGQTNLPQAIDLLFCADAVVSNDSGLAHMAAALGRNLVVIYGSTSPELAPPLNDNHRILYLDLGCSPCRKRECPLTHLDCLHKLMPERVFSALDELIPTTIPVRETDFL